MEYSCLLRFFFFLWLAGQPAQAYAVPAGQQAGQQYQQPYAGQPAQQAYVSQPVQQPYGGQPVQQPYGQVCIYHIIYYMGVIFLDLLFLVRNVKNVKILPKQ